MRNFLTEQELKTKGFELVQDGDEVYYQFISDRDNYFGSDYLYTTKNAFGEYSVFKKDGSVLNEEDVEIYINKSGGKEAFSAEELRNLGFELAPSAKGYKLVYYFDTNDAFSKTLETEEATQKQIKSGKPFKVVNHINSEKNKFKYLSENQIKKLIERGGF